MVVKQNEKFRKETFIIAFYNLRVFKFFDGKCNSGIGMLIAKEDV